MDLLKRLSRLIAASSSSIVIAAVILHSPIFAAKKQLVIYSYQSFTSSFGLGPILAKEFEQTCNCEVKFSGFADANLILARLKLEQEHSIADIAIGIDNMLLKSAEATALFAPHQLNLNQADFIIPQALGSAYFIPYDFGFLSFVHKGNSSAAISFDSWLQGVDAKSIVLQDPRSSSPGLVFINWLQALDPEKFNSRLSALKPKTINYAQSWDKAYEQFLSGGAEYVWSYSTSPLYHQLVEGDNSFAALKLSGTEAMQVEYAAIVKSSKNKELARDFIKFLISPAAQRQIPMKQWIFPVIKTTLPAEFKNALPEKISKIELPTEDQIDKLIKTWLKAIN